MRTYGSWMKGQQTLEETLRNMLHVLPPEILHMKVSDAGLEDRTKIFMISKPAIEVDGVTEEGFTAWKIEYKKPNEESSSKV